MNYKEIDTFVKGITGETEAILIFHAMKDRFGWAGTLFTRSDAESVAEGEELTDEEWENLSQSRGWTRYIGEAMSDNAWDAISEAVAEVQVEQKQEAI